MTISNSNLLKPFITGSKLLPFKDDVFSKTEEQFKKSPHGKSLFISGNENLVNISAEKIDEIKNSKNFFSNIVNIIILLIKHPDKILPILHGCPAESIEFIKNAKRTGEWSYEMIDKNGQSIEVSYIFTDTIDNKSDGKLCLKICNSCNQNDSSTHEYKIDHQQLKNHIRQLEEWALLEKFYDNNAYYSKRTKQLEKKIAKAGFITGKVNAEKFNVKEFKDDITSMLCEQPPLRTHQISSSGYVSADKLPKLYELNLKDAQRDLANTPVDINGVSLELKTRRHLADIIHVKCMREKNYTTDQGFELPEEVIHALLLDYSDEQQIILRPFFQSAHMDCLFDAFCQELHNISRDGSPRYADLIEQIGSNSEKLQDFDQQLFWRTFTGGVLHRHISVKSEPEKTDVWRFSSQFDFPHINENGELSRTVLMFEGVAESNFKDIANHSSECFSYRCYAAPLDANAKK
ncbi:TPA: hypothetical protein ACHJ26_002268 [Escherichia coli]|uniref:hypothetical protein n=1 Tax=Escherichia coli TaxID=562 RepID=UPI000A2D1DAD|nr:hypothetical protein [Escherichia coli]EGM7792172.1 hypothetical protein [Escherichia coli]EHX1938186.1 hypothetical protein [Escherichia coli]EHX8707267.1 hypothetical protein [Escherichia coli]OTC14326.1 hypothetical protein AW074_12625 [Escherichia coli]TJQ01774.1 hypothetical protein C9Z70_09545 [Escherichia coli]